MSNGKVKKCTNLCCQLCINKRNQEPIVSKLLQGDLFRLRSLNANMTIGGLNLRMKIELMKKVKILQCVSRTCR